MFQNKYKKIIFSIIYLSPTLAFAAINNLKDFATGLVSIINFLNNFLIAISAAIIIFGIFRYLVASGDKDRLSKARDVIVYGLLGVLIMYSIMGLLNILIGTFVFNNTAIPIPKFGP